MSAAPDRPFNAWGTWATSPEAARSNTAGTHWAAGGEGRMSGPHADEPRQLTPELVTYYREMLDVHSNRSGACEVCHKSRCPDWLHAYDMLASAGELMGDASEWDEKKYR